MRIYSFCLRVVLEDAMAEAEAVQHRQKKWALAGKPEYSVWYGQFQKLVVILVSVEAKCPGSAGWS